MALEALQHLGADSKFSPQRHLMEALLDQPQGVQGRPPGQGDPPASVAVVVDHRHGASLHPQQLPLHPRVSPAGPQSHPLAEHFGVDERRLQPAAALQDAAGVAFVHLQAPVMLLPGAADGDAVDSRVDVGLPVSVPDKMLQPGCLHLQDLTSDRVHLAIVHQRFGAEPGAVNDDVIAVAAQLLEAVDLPLHYLSSQLHEPFQHKYVKYLPK